MAYFIPAELYHEFLLSFWLPACIAHLIAFGIANRNDIIMKWRLFYLGDLLGWLLVVGVTFLFIDLLHFPEWVLWIFFGAYILIISTLASNLAYFHASSNFKTIITETLVESIIVPWIAGITLGSIIAFCVWAFI